MIRNWTQIGAEYSETVRQKSELSDIFDNFEWHILPYKMNPIQAASIRRAIDSYKLVGVKAIAFSFALSPLSVLGIECHFKNGVQRVYFIDTGKTIVPVADDQIEKEVLCQKKPN